MPGLPVLRTGLLLLLCVLPMMSACGNKGGLYLPADPVTSDTTEDAGKTAKDDKSE